jgi:transcriptional regulator with XRE-family HTH domain
MNWVFRNERIKMAREARDITQAKLAELIGASPQQLSQWEIGAIKPGQDSLIKICNALGCTPRFFFIDLDDDDNHQNGE